MQLSIAPSSSRNHAFCVRLTALNPTPGEPKDRRHTQIPVMMLPHASGERKLSKVRLLWLALIAKRYIDCGEHASPALYERQQLDLRGMKATSFITINARKLNGRWIDVIGHVET